MFYLRTDFFSSWNSEIVAAGMDAANQGCRKTVQLRRFEMD